MVETSETGEAVAEVRAFNRFYTGRLGLLDERQLESPFTLTEMRVLYEIAHDPGTTAARLCRELNLDAGYCSRLVGRFVKRRQVASAADPADGRRSSLSLTEEGREAFAPLDLASSAQVGELIAALGQHDKRRLVGAMRTIRQLLGDDEAAGWTLRELRPGDLGWIVHRHAVLYAEEYGFDARFEALVAEVATDFARNPDPARACARVADCAGAVAGAVLVTAKSPAAAQLRLLYVEPAMRGQGVGAELVDAAVGFARGAGYATITLWTNDVLVAARRLYERAAFRLVASEPHARFGPEMVGETWTLDL